MKNYQNVDEYIAAAPANVQAGLKLLRKTIQSVAPNANERISYGIPTYSLKRNLVHFAGYETHYGFYPGAQAIVEFEADLKDYQTSKGTVRFPIDKPLPVELIKKITLYRLQAELNRQ